MFYEIEMLPEHIQSLLNAINTVDNKENITVDLSHNEVLLSMDIVNLIKERVFDDYNRD